MNEKEIKIIMEIKEKDKESTKVIINDILEDDCHCVKLITDGKHKLLDFYVK